MNTIATKRAPWWVRLFLRAYLRSRIRWIDTDIAADAKLMNTLPFRIAAHERVAANLRCELALLED